MINKYWDALVYSLRTSILADVNVLQDFIYEFQNSVYEQTPDSIDLMEFSDKYKRINVSDYPKVNIFTKFIATTKT